MAAQITTALAEVATVWEAVTPPDRTGLSFRRLATGQTLDGVSQDRVFTFGTPKRAKLTIGNDNVSLVLWEVEARVRLSGSGRDADDLTAEYLDVTQALNAALEANGGAWAESLTVLTSDTELEDRDDEGAPPVAVVRLSVETWESY